MLESGIEKMNPRQEFVRLQQLASTREGWEKLEQEFNNACDKHASGNIIAGVAIDTETMEYNQTPFGYHHHAASRDNLIKKCMERDHLDPSEAEDRVIGGYIVPVPSFKLPLVMLGSWRILPRTTEPELLPKLEEFIITNNIGLPVNSLFLKKATESGK